jgi:RNA polymerase sigma factor (sigma-70 family)
MDVQDAGENPERRGKPETPPAAAVSRSGALSAERVGRALGEWQSAELRLARSFGECRDLGREQLEDLYQETTVILLSRPFHNEEHLRNALRWGIKHRALHMHRDERRRAEILDQRTPELSSQAKAREQARSPELAALADEDRLVVAEFLTELSMLERRVFWLMAEGMRYRAIAPALQVPVNEARKAARSCERKRARFQLLHDTGRLCGYRAHTIQALKEGRASSEQLMLGAYAHLEGCAACRAEHHTNARRLRRSFQGQAAALLPIPMLTGSLGRLARIDLRLRSVAHRLLGTPFPGSGGARERAVAMLASGGAAVKLAAVGATVAVLAGGTLGVTHALHSRHIRRRASAHAAAASRTTASTAPQPATYSAAPAATGSEAQPSRAPSATKAQRQPGGFAFLGVPGRSAPRAASGHAASVSRTAHVTARTGGERSTQKGGGPFSP